MTYKYVNTNTYHVSDEITNAAKWPNECHERPNTSRENKFFIAEA